MTRLFIGLQPSPEFRDALTILQERLREAGVNGRFLAPSNLHLTLAFIGMRPDPEKVLPLLPPVEKPFPVILSHAGIFPKADVLWAGTQPSAELDELAARVRARLTEAGVPFDGRPFVPHITLARKLSLPEGFSIDSFQVPEAAFYVREVCLYKSERGEDGMVYSVIGSSLHMTEGKV